jgi:FkbM family methyltransferase
MSAQNIALFKLVQSVSSKQYNSWRNKIVRAKGDGLRYDQFHSQFGEDRYIFEKLKVPAQGVFVDVGAGHPIYLSNTYFFERNGWTGLCVDADPTQVELLKKERANVEWAAVADVEGEIEFSQSYFPTFSSTAGKDDYKGVLKVPIKQTIKVPSFRLDTLLDKHGIGLVDLLDIDVEGLEVKVLQTLNFEKHKPRVILLEFQAFGLGDYSQEIKDFFAPLPYDLVHTTCTNFIFVHRER